MGGDPGVQPTYRWDFFISYTQADELWAKWIAWHLDSVGYRVLLQAWDMPTGTDWIAAMQDGMQYAERTLAVLSNAYLNSVYGELEWQAARRADPSGIVRKLLPVRVEDGPRPAALDTIVGLDLFGLPETMARDALFEQVAAARRGSGKPTAAPTFPGVSRSLRYFNRRIPEEAHLAMGRVAHRGIATFAFTGSNGWALVTGDGSYRTRGLTRSCFEQLRTAAISGSRVGCVAFVPYERDGWVVATEREVWTQNVPPGCERRIRQTIDDGQQLVHVAFCPQRSGWAVVDGMGVTVEGVDPDFRRAVLELAERRTLRQVAFTPGGGWLASADGDVRSHGIDDECRNVVDEFLADGWRLTNVAFAAHRNGWSLVADERVSAT